MLRVQTEDTSTLLWFSLCCERRHSWNYYCITKKQKSWENIWTNLQLLRPIFRRFPQCNSSVSLSALRLCLGLISGGCLNPLWQKDVKKQREKVAYICPWWSFSLNHFSISIYHYCTPGGALSSRCGQKQQMWLVYPLNEAVIQSCTLCLSHGKYSAVGSWYFYGRMRLNQRVR